MTYHFRSVSANSEGITWGPDATFTTLSTLEDWKLAMLGDVNAPDLGDPDLDGLNNLAEYALLSPPTVPDAGLKPEMATYLEGRRLRLFFQRDPARDDVTIEVQAADDPAGPWMTLASSIKGAVTSGSGYVYGDNSGPGLKTVEVRDVINVDAASARFLRIRVTR